MLPSGWTTTKWHYINGWIVPQTDAYLSVVLSCILAFGIGLVLGGTYRRAHILMFVTSWFVIGTWFFTSNTLRQPVPALFLFEALGLIGNVLAMLSTLAGRC